MLQGVGIDNSLDSRVASWRGALEIMEESHPTVLRASTSNRQDVPIMTAEVLQMEAMP